MPSAAQQPAHTKKKHAERRLDRLVGQTVQWPTVKVAGRHSMTQSTVNDDQS